LWSSTPPPISSGHHPSASHPFIECLDVVSLLVFDFCKELVGAFEVFTAIVAVSVFRIND